MAELDNFVAWNQEQAKLGYLPTPGGWLRPDGSILRYTGQSPSGSAQTAALENILSKQPFPSGNLPVALDKYAGNPLIAAGLAGAAGLAVGALGVAGVAALRSSKPRRRRGKAKGSPRSRRPSKGRTATSRRNAKRNRRGGAVKARYKGRKVLLTKKGQPYVLMANGKARFIKR